MAQVFYFHPLQPYQPKGFIALVPFQRRALPYNMLLNGGFDDTSAWTLGSGCSISGSRLNATAAGQICQQVVSWVNGNTYQIDLDYTCTSGSKLRINQDLVNGSNIRVTSGALITDGTSQHLTLTFTSNVAGNNYFSLEADSAVFSGTIDNITLKEVISSVVSHDATGVLTGPGSTIAGTAVYNAVHPTSGALTGPGSTIVGSAARTAVHTTTGALTGQGSTIAGVAVYNAKHTTSGALTGAGSVVVGAAARTRVHATTGTVVGPGSTIAGTAVYNAKHTTSGALTGPGSTVAGTAARFRAFATSGVLVGAGSTIVGAATRSGIVVTVHATSGALVGQPSIIDGTAARTRHHATSGVLVGPPALIVGVNARWRDHGSSGAILGVTGVVFGRAFNGTPQLHDIPVDSDNLTDEPASPSANLGTITEPGGQIVNHPPYPPA